MKLIKQTLAKPQVRGALVAFGRASLDRALDCAIMKLQEFEKALKREADIVDVECEEVEDEKDVTKM